MGTSNMLYAAGWKPVTCYIHKYGDQSQAKCSGMGPVTCYMQSMATDNSVFSVYEITSTTKCNSQFEHHHSCPGHIYAIREYIM